MYAGWGDANAAAPEITDTIALGRMLQEGEGDLIHYLVGVAIECIGMRSARGLAQQPDASPELVSLLLGAIRPAGAANEGLAQALRVSFEAHVLTIISRIDEKDPDLAGALAQMKTTDSTVFSSLETLLAGLPRPFDRAETVRLAGKSFQAHVRSTARPWNKRDETADRDLRVVRETLQPLALAYHRGREVSAQELETAVKALSEAPNPLGRVLVALVVPSLGRISEQSFRLRTLCEITRAFLALRVYALRHGEYPDSLGALVKEKILPAVPTDMFADKPVRYDLKRRRLWSVGPDAVDDGGTDAPEDWEGKDYVLELPPLKH